MEALLYDDIVLINAPFTQEIRDDAYIATLRKELAKKEAELVVIWVDTDPEVCHQRMIDPRQRPRYLEADPLGRIHPRRQL